MKNGLPRWLCLPIALLLVALAAAACGDDDDTEPSSAAATPTATAVAASPGSPPASQFPQTVVDWSGAEITLERAPRRIISYSPAATETLFAIGAGDQVIATDEFSNYPPEVAALPKLPYVQPAPEPALDLEPDLVIMAGAQEGQVAQFRDVGLTVLFVREPENLAGVLDQVRLFGRLSGKPEAAETLAGEMEDRIAAVEAAVAAVDAGPLVFVELTPDGYTVGTDSFIGSMLTIVKARNVAAGVDSQFPQLSAEVVIAANPDVILLTDAGDMGGQSLETVRERPGWDVIAAVASGRVYPVDGDLFSRPGPRIVEALEALVALLYP